MSSERPAEESRKIPFQLLQAIQAGLETHGYLFVPVEREHTEGLITEPLAHRLRSRIKRRGFSKVAGRVMVTFSGYDDDPREIFDIPEIGAYFRRLDSEVVELPALLAYLPEMGFNGPGQYLMLLGEIDETIDRPEMGGYDVHVRGAERIISQAVDRIEQASAKYGLSQIQRSRLIAAFLSGATHRFP